MKLDEFATEQRLSLDVTPLIDVVFLLVLFFAVTTSFISPEDLDELKSDLFGVTEEKIRLSGEVADYSERLDQQQSTIATLEQNYQILSQDFESAVASNEKRIAELRVAIQDAESRKTEYEWTIAALEQQQDGLEKRLSETTDRAQSMEEQLANAYEDYKALNVDIAVLAEKNEGLVASEGTLRARVAELEAEQEKFEKLAKLDEGQLEKLLRAQQELESGLGEYLQRNQLGLLREKQRLVLQLSDQILFDSGSAEMKPEGLEVLRQVGSILQRRIGDLDVQIGGHTDNVPIPVGAKGPYRDNWALSAARAVTVVNFLENEVGVNAQKLSAIGFGEHRPVSLNDTVAGRALNRRIEIVVLPY